MHQRAQCGTLSAGIGGDGQRQRLGQCRQHVDLSAKGFGCVILGHLNLCLLGVLPIRKILPVDAFLDAGDDRLQSHDAGLHHGGPDMPAQRPIGLAQRGQCAFEGQFAQLVHFQLLCQLFAQGCVGGQINLGCALLRQVCHAEDQRRVGHGRASEHLS